MRVLVACEESQAVCIAFRNRGHEAYSCDIQECSGGHPEWHTKGDVLRLINGDCDFWTMDDNYHVIQGQWDLLIAFPPCTYMTNAGAVRMCVNGVIQEERYQKMLEAKKFFMALYNANCPRIAIENPTPMAIVGLPQYSQAIQPWQFGHPYTKRTCLWLKGLKLLKPAKVIKEGIQPYVNGGNKDTKGNYRRFKGRNERDPKTRSKTFTGVADAMSVQWGGNIK